MSRHATLVLVIDNRRERDRPNNLLSDHVVIVTRINLEAAVIGPEVDRSADACDSALIHLLT